MPFLGRCIPFCCRSTRWSTCWHAPRSFIIPRVWSSISRGSSSSMPWSSPCSRWGCCGRWGAFRTGASTSGASGGGPCSSARSVMCFAPWRSPGFRRRFSCASSCWPRLVARGCASWCRSIGKSACTSQPWGPPWLCLSSWASPTPGVRSCRSPPPSSAPGHWLPPGSTWVATTLRRSSPGSAADSASLRWRCCSFDFLQPSACGRYTHPWASMALATFMKPPMLAPTT